MTTEKDYVLGTHDEEVARLGLQHRVWRPRAADAWRRGGFTAGQSLLDVGCGPGYASIDLAEIVGARGRVIAVDRSRRFLDVLRATASARGLANVETHELDLDEQPLPDIHVDGAWSRWVYAFVRHPRRLLENVARTVRPGGTIVAHEYADYRSWRYWPVRPEMAAFVDEVIASWRADGGEPDVGMALPAWLDEAGFEVRSLLPLVEIARPTDFTWQWPQAFLRVGLQRMVDLGRIDPARGAAMASAFEETLADPRAFTLTPTVIEVVAVRR